MKGGARYSRTDLRAMIQSRCAEANLKPAYSLEDLHRRYAQERVVMVCRDLWGEPSGGWDDIVWVPCRAFPGDAST